MSTQFSVYFNGTIDGAVGLVTAGYGLVQNTGGTAFVISTLANRGAQRTVGIAVSVATGGKAVQIQSDGYCERGLTLIPYLAGADYTPIRVNAAGLLERANPVLSGDEIVGSCNAFGDAILTFGQPTSSIITTLAGDVTGPAAATVVGKIQGHPVENINPSAGNYMIWDGTKWSIQGLVAALSGDVTGNYNSNTVIKIRGISISAGAPTAGQSLVATSGTTATWGSTSVTMAGDVTGPSGSNTVVALQGRSMSAAAPSTNDVLEWNGSTWAPAASPAITLAGDVSGSSSANTVDKIKNISVVLTSPATGQVLEYNGTNFVNAAPTGLVTLAGDVSGGAGANTVDKIKNITVTFTSPAAGQVLEYNGSAFVNAAPSGLVTLAGDSVGLANANTLQSVTGNSGAVAVASNVSWNYASSGSLTGASNVLKWTGSAGIYCDAVSNIDARFGPLDTTNAGIWAGASAASPSNTNYVLLFDSAGAVTTIRGTSEVRINSPALGFAAAISSPEVSQDSAAGAGQTLTVSGQNSSTTTGGDVVIRGGLETGAAKLAGVRVGFHGQSMVEVRDYSTTGTGRVTALNVGAALGSQVTVGDKVTFIADAASLVANVADAPTGGVVVQSSSGKLQVMNTDGYLVTI